MPQATPQRRRWFQFSLRALLVATAAVAGLAFAWMKTVEPYRLQREAMAVITKLGGTYETEAAAQWIRYFDNNAQDIIAVDLAHCRNTPYFARIPCGTPNDYLPCLARLPRLRRLEIGGRGFDDDALAIVGSLTSLEHIVLDDTSISDDGMAHVASLDIHVLSICRTAISDAGLMHLASSPHLQIVKASETHVGNVGLAIIANLPLIDSIDLSRTAVTDDGLVHLQRARTLRGISLDGTTITDKGVAHLEQCTQLRGLTVRQTEISPSGIQRLKATLPHCEIRH